MSQKSLSTQFATLIPLELTEGIQKRWLHSGLVAQSLLTVPGSSVIRPTKKWLMVRGGHFWIERGQHGQHHEDQFATKIWWRTPTPPVTQVHPHRVGLDFGREFARRLAHKGPIPSGSWSRWLIRPGSTFSIAATDEASMGSASPGS